MGKPKRKKQLGPQRQEAPRARVSVFRVILFALLLGAIPVLLFRFGPAGSPTAYSAENLDSAAAAQIELAIAEVNATPRSGATWGKLGLIFQQYEFDEQALDCFEAAARLDSNDARWPYLQGLLRRQRNAAASLESFRRAARLAGSGNDAPGLALGRLLLDLGRFPEAEEQFQTLLQRQYNHPPARLALAEISFQRGNLDSVAKHLETALTNSHTARQAHSLLAVVEQRRGNTEAARAARRRAETLPLDLPWPDPILAEAGQYHENLKALLDRVQALRQSGQASETLPLISRILKDYPQSAQGWLFFGWAQMDEQKCAEAEAAFRRHLQLQSESVNGWAWLGVALLCQDRFAEAASAFQKATELKPDFAMAYFNRGFALARLGQSDNAIEAFRNATRYNPALLDAYVFAGELLLQSGRRGEALPLLQQAHSLAPSDPRVRELLNAVP